MSNPSLKQLKELFSVYSPLTSNNKLYDNYIKITGDTSQSLNSIRHKYNKEIFNGFLNENVIKSSFINKFCINKSPRNTITIFELNTVNSRADLCIINGKSFSFEIKTEYDNFFRLNKQLLDYNQTFDYLSIIIPSSSLENTINQIEDSIGIITYRINRKNNISFDIFRDPSINKNINAQIQLNQLTLKQLQEIIQEKKTKDEIIDFILNNYTIDEINQLYKTKIKEKYSKQWNFLIENISQIHPLDYQWFFKNNIPTTIVYK